VTDAPARPAHARADLALARRLERAEARTNAAFVEARARLDPAAGAAWCEVAGTYVMCDGAGSPLTQTFGLGLFAAAAPGDLDAIERFFAERGADAMHEVCPMADAGLLALLPDRGYRPVEWSTVLHRPPALPLPPAPAPAAGAPPLAVRAVAPGEADLWADTSARGWGDTPELAAFVRAFGRVSAASAGTLCFLAEAGGEPVAAGALAVHDGVALLAGASTVPAWRGRGAQAALLRARLARAAALGCDLAAMVAAPGSTSQTNAERQGFRVAYTRLKWGRAGGGAPGAGA
jgi:GNAT superfamily N-acetyltransferase